VGFGGFIVLGGSWVLLYYVGSIVSWVFVGGFLLHFGCLVVFVGSFFCILGFGSCGFVVPCGFSWVFYVG
jgi:hypothetical protein